MEELSRISILLNAYPDIDFGLCYDAAEDDYVLSFTNPATQKYYEFYWCGGAMLPKEELANHNQYWTLLYRYENTLRDPADMTEEERERLKTFTAPANRQNGAGTPMFFFDALYSGESQKSLEAQLTRTTFLDKPIRVHSRIVEPLKRVEERIYADAPHDAEVQKFLDNLKGTDAYYWRLIEGTKRKSFHSYGIAVDIIPVYYGGEAFWSWARDHNPSGWMLTPLSRRWLPPPAVIRAFEQEGFIWGGYWAIWDNMHFEYHPELTLQLDGN